MSEEMRKLAEIRHSFSIKKYGEPTNEEIALIKYDELCLSLIFENQQLNNTNIQLSTLNTNLRSARDKYKSALDEIRKYIEDKIYSIEPKGTRINYICEYDSEEDFISAMEERSRLNTLKEVLQILDKVKK